MDRLIHSDLSVADAGGVEPYRLLLSSPYNALRNGSAPSVPLDSQECGGRVLSQDKGFTIDLVPTITAHSSLNHDGAVDSDKCGDNTSGDSKMFYQSLSTISLANFGVC